MTGVKKQQLPREKGVTRIDDPGRHGVGWYARVVFMGQTFSKYFADLAHGGTRKAFDKAVKWRNDTEAAVGKPRTDRLFAMPGVRSQTGIQGVYEQNGKYVAAWTPKPGQTRRKFFSINKYGEQEALRKAINFRRQREREVYGRAVANASVATSHPRAKGSAKRARPSQRRRAQRPTAPRRRPQRATQTRSRSRSR